MKAKFEIEFEVNPASLQEERRQKPPREHTREFLAEEMRLFLEDDALDGFWVGGILYDVKKVIRLDP